MQTDRDRNSIQWCISLGGDVHSREKEDGEILITDSRNTPTTKELSGYWNSATEIIQKRRSRQSSTAENLEIIPKELPPQAEKLGVPRISNHDAVFNSESESESTMKEIPAIHGDIIPGGGVYDLVTVEKFDVSPLMADVYDSSKISSKNIKSSDTIRLKSGVILMANSLISDDGLSDGTHGIENVEQLHRMSETMKPLGHKGFSIRNFNFIFHQSHDKVGTFLMHAPRLTALTSMNGNGRYFNTCFSVRGRTCPWKPIFLIMIWSFLVYLLHDFGYGLIPNFKLQVSGWIYTVLGISVGFLLKSQAMTANNRWMEARQHWEKLISYTRNLSVYLLSCNTCEALAREVIIHSMACTLCIKNYLMDVSDDMWISQLMLVLPAEECKQILLYNRRARWTYCLYACQRTVEMMIKERLITRGSSRDINPILLKLSIAAGHCSKIRLTQIPWSYIMHVRLLLVIYLMFVPLMLVGLDDMTWPVLLAYSLPIAYAFAGLEWMSASILNPFNEGESDHPLDLYCYLILNDVRELTGPQFAEKYSFVKTFDEYYTGRLQHWFKTLHPHKIFRPKQRKLKELEFQKDSDVKCKPDTALVHPKEKNVDLSNCQ